MKNIIKEISKFRKYETPIWIRQEFVDFLKWSDYNKTDEECNKMLDSYFEANDISLHGDIRKMHGTNSRNSTFELTCAICAAIAGCILAIVIVNYFIF